MYKVQNIQFNQQKNVLEFEAVDESGKVHKDALTQKRSIEHIFKIARNNNIVNSDDHAQLLYSIARFMRSKVIVEVGVAYGDTTKWLCQAAKINDGFVYGFDVWEEHGVGNMRYGQKSSKEDVEKYLKYFHNCSNFKLEKVNTISDKENFENMIKELGPLDFVFIDGDHSLAGVSNDFEIVYPYLSDKAVVVFHDTLICDGSRQFAHELRTKYKDSTFDVIDLPYGNFAQRCGLTMLFKRSFSTCGVDIIENCGATLSFEEIYENERKIIEGKNDT